MSTYVECIVETKWYGRTIEARRGTQVRVVCLRNNASLIAKQQ